MAFPLVSSLFGGVEYDRPSLNPFCFSEKIFCFLFVRFLERIKCVASLRYLTEMLECKVNLTV